MSSILDPQAIGAFADEHRQAVYDAIGLRRDVRHFQPHRPVPREIVDRILGAAHLAPSVGFSQPWGFVLMEDRAKRERIRESFLRCREAEVVRFPPGRREAYLAHKLEGIVEAPLNLCVAVDWRPQGEAILGTTAQPEAVRASAVCAVQNLWLAARAEGIGVGWVSIVEPAVLRAELALPPGVEPVAYLCIGYPVAFREKPMLEETRWRARRPLAEVVHAHGRWQDPPQGHELPPADPPTALPIPKEAPAGQIPPLDEDARDRAEIRQARLTKPVGSLGRLEELAAFYAAARGGPEPPPPVQGAVVVFAGDHGVVVEGTSAYGSPVTAAMVKNVMAGGAGINALATSQGLPLFLVDVGVAGDLSALPTRPVVPLWNRRVAAGTRNLRETEAMTVQTARAAMAVGARTAVEILEGGINALAVGEIGIGNTTAAAALIAVFTGRPPAEVVGGGTGISAAVRDRKVATVGAALARHRPHPQRPLEALAAVGGLEIAALAGCMLASAARRTPVVLDGVVTNAAALVAAAIDPDVTGYLLAASRSPEPGSSAALAHLGLEPLLDLGLRLGEGTGAALGLGVLRAAVAAFLQMATFETAGIVGR